MVDGDPACTSLSPMHHVLIGHAPPLSVGRQATAHADQLVGADAMLVILSPEAGMSPGAVFGADFCARFGFFGPGAPDPVWRCSAGSSAVRK